MTVLENKFTRWDVDKHHPNSRCIITVKHGQCPYLKSGEGNYCEQHGANKGRLTKSNEIQRNYRLQRWQQRISDFADNDQIKSLREEVGILRMMMEEMLNKCESTTDLLLYSSRIADVAMKIEKLVVSCDKLENRMGMLLSKRAVLQLAGEYVQIINMHITDPEVMEQIGEKMLEATQRIDNLAIEAAV